MRRHRGAIERDERPAAALAGAVDGARQQVLAGAALALDQHRGVGRRRLARAAQHAGHRLAFGNDVGEGQPPLAAVAERAQLLSQCRSIERIAQGDGEPFEGRRRGQEIAGAGGERHRHGVGPVGAGLHDDGDMNAGLHEPPQHAHAVEAGQHEVDECHVERPFGQRRDGGVAAAHRGDIVAALPHHGLGRRAPREVVVGNQNPRHRVRSCPDLRQCGRQSLKGLLSGAASAVGRWAAGAARAAVDRRHRPALWS